MVFLRFFYIFMLLFCFFVSVFMVLVYAVDFVTEVMT